MTNLSDLSASEKYLTLEVVEFFEFLTRVAMESFSKEKSLSIPEKVFKLLQRIWQHRKANKPKVDPKEKKKKKQKKFPELVELVEDEPESD